MYNLTKELNEADFTLLLPTDEAIRQHLSRTNSSVLDSDVFKYHVILKELLFPNHLSDGMLKSTMLGEDYQVQFHLDNKNQTVVNGVPLDGTFTETEYGIIMVLPQVLKIQRNRCSKQITVQVNGRCTDCDGPPRCLFNYKPGSVWVNNRSRIVRSDYTTTNGVIHHVDKLLTPYGLQEKPNIQPNTMNLTRAAVFYGYNRFYKLIEDAGLISVLKESIHQPFTMFWPTDQALSSLPAERQRWLSSPDHQDQLAAIVKAHIIRNSKIMGISQPHASSSFRTMHGSTIKYSCDKSVVGAVLINTNAARIGERFLAFKEGIAYGIDQLLEPPGLGAHCDTLENRTTYGRCGTCYNPPSCPFRHQSTGKTESCLNYRSRYGIGYSSWYDDLENPFSRRGCKKVCVFASWVQKCCKNHYSRDCQVCPGGLESPCSNHGNCDDGLTGSGRCRCHDGFKGRACELCLSGHYGPNCTEECRQCHAQADCVPGVGCQCKPGFQGNGTICSPEPPPDLCLEYNGGCHETPTVTRRDCSSTAPVKVVTKETASPAIPSTVWFLQNERQCECLTGYVGNGVQCLEKVVPPVDRCLEDNGGCDPVAACTDRHFFANTAGVFHLRSPEGKYKMNFSQADAACQAEGATLANFKQLGDAQQMGMHLCVAGWMEGGKVGYPTRFPSVKCGDNHVGLVIYKDPVDQSSKYDAYCYRVKDVSCVCPAGYIGNGDFCNGVLTNVLATYSNFSIFYKFLLDYSGSSSEGKQLVEFLSHRTSGVTLFVPHNSGFTQNKSFKLVNKRQLVDWDIPAVNGIIHVIEAPLTAPPAPVSGDGLTQSC
ncbi:Stabilin-1 [Nibea albiflora]|uniref:Stabilin-1 n=1 Tax=Nibea albiflora TaxID=240163 RepID=A0ACB7F1R2_NIBAL|nr:Stabilin-1 [Nibea albiflora]